jgi:hypothetical protein
MVQPKQELLPAASSSLAGSDLTGIPTALPLAAPILQRSPSSSSAEHHQQLVSNEGAHRRSPSLAATATMAASCHGGAFAGAAASSGRPALAHPLPQIGTVSNRPPVLQLETSNLWWAGDDQSKGRSTEIELSPNRSASSSPVSRSHSRAAAKASDHLSSASYQSQTALISNGSGANGLSHHTPSNLRHSRVPSMNSPPQPTSSFPDPTPVGRLVRPGLVSYHSHLQPDQTLPWQERLRLACTSPDTGRWRMPQVLTPYVPLMAWAGTSLGFVVAFTFFRQELFTGLDTMSVSLAGMGLLGKTIMGVSAPVDPAPIGTGPQNADQDLHLYRRPPYLPHVLPAAAAVLNAHHPQRLRFRRLGRLRHQLCRCAPGTPRLARLVCHSRHTLTTGCCAHDSLGCLDCLPPLAVALPGRDDPHVSRGVIQDPAGVLSAEDATSALVSLGCRSRHPWLGSSMRSSADRRCSSSSDSPLTRTTS